MCVCLGGGECPKNSSWSLGGGGVDKNEGKVWGVHIIPVGNILNSSEHPQAINFDRSLTSGLSPCNLPVAIIPQADHSNSASW